MHITNSVKLNIFAGGSHASDGHYELLWSLGHTGNNHKEVQEKSVRMWIAVFRKVMSKYTFLQIYSIDISSEILKHILLSFHSIIYQYIFVIVS